LGGKIKILLRRLPMPIRWVLFTFFARPMRKASFITMKKSESLYRNSVKVMAALGQGQFKRSRSQNLAAQKKMMRYLDDLLVRIEKLPLQPKISILLPVYKVPLTYLAETLACVEAQIYKNWELCIVDDGSQDEGISGMIQRFARRYPQNVKFKAHSQNQHISATSNSCLEIATGDFVALFDHDDRIYPHALAEFVRYLNNNPNSDVFYSDERAVGERGEQTSNPFYKPGWSPQLHLQVNYTTHFSFYRTEVLRSIGGFQIGYEGSQDHDVMLRMVEKTTDPVVHIPLCLYEWRVHANSTASNIAAKPYAVTSGIRCVSDAIERKNRSASVTYNSRTCHYDIRYKIKGEPLVSIIIPSKDHPDVISKCLDSIFHRSSYQNFEVIVVDNGSTDPKCQILYATWKTKEPKRFRAIEQPGVFNFGRLNNYGVSESCGDYVLLLNNDTEVISPAWIEALLQYGQFPEIGAVGAQLRYPDGTIQHAGGVLLGPDIGGHIGRGLHPENRMYIDFIQTSHECAFVTAACLLINKEKYLEAGGLDELNVPNGYGDVDFCLKLRTRGLTSIYSHHAVLTHFESKTRGRAIEIYEKKYMLKTWSHELLNDPYLNPNLKMGEVFEPLEIESLAEPSEDFVSEYLAKFLENIN
jgi:glycosyltransferase involved in cell wall biosynthesis